MPFSDPITQGGQTFLHKMRMIRQIARLAIFIALIAGFAGFGFYLKKNTTPQTLQTAKHYVLAHYKILIEGEEAILNIKDSSGIHTVWAKNFLLLPSTTKHIELFKKSLISSGMVGGGCFVIAMIVILWSWSKKARKDKRETYIGGQKICSWHSLRTKLRLAGQASNIKIGELPLLKDSETKHIFISGTTGSGKTNCFYHILSDIKSLESKAIIIDTTGDYVSRFFREDRDILLSPLDKRSVTWHPWIECTQKYHYYEMAKNFISSDISHDPFWTNSARVVISATLEKMAETGIFNIRTFLDLLTKDSLENLYLFLKDTEAASLIDPIADKTSSSIRATVGSYVSSLNFLESTNTPFSIRKWVQDDGVNNWLFISITPEQRDALRPLISAWTSIAVKSLLGCVPNENRRLWFFIDELPTLHKINDLTTCLAEGRKYGGCMALGLQNLPQLEELYGVHQTRTIIDLCSTKVILRMASYDLAERLSKALGERQISEIQEGISYGANEIRDGVSLSKINREKPAVSPTDLMSLEDLEAYVKLPGNYPLTKVKMKYMSLPKISKAYVSKSDEQKILS